MQINQIGAAPIVDKYKGNIEVGNSSIEVQEDSSPSENHNHQSIVNLNKLGLSGPINTDNYQTIYTFENCGATGRYGPSQSQIDNTYSGNNTLSGDVTVNNNGIQSWVVPVSGNYHIIAAGAQGGDTHPYNGGMGAQIAGDFYLNEGDILKIIVGQQGIAYDDDNAWGRYDLGGSGGGGGSFVVKSPYNTNESILVIAGGGGGSVDNLKTRRDGKPGVTSNNGTSSHITGSGNSYNGSAHGGTNGNGGGNGCGAGGGGFFGNGNNGTHASYGGSSFTNGGVGGNSQHSTGHTYGGFGSGGAGSPNWGYGGGGGGYSGGGGGAWVNQQTGNGGGGGSYNNGENTNGLEGVRSGHGIVYISLYAQGNQMPIANSQNITTNEDVSLSITLSGSDEDGDNLTHHIVSNPSFGTLSGSAWNYTYIPSTNWHGADSFTFTVHDGTETSESATISITVNPVNDAPTVSDQSASGTEDQVQTFTLSSNDIEGGAITYSVSNPSNGSATLDGSTVTYTPDPNYHGSDSFTFSAFDGEDISNEATFSINLTPVNDYPTINSTPVLDIVEGHSYEYAISLHDIDGDQLSLTAPTKPNWLDLTAQYSYSLDFDGSNDYVSVNDYIISTNELTFETWIYPHNVNGWRAIRNETGWNGGDIHFQILNSKLEFSLHGNSPTDQWFDHTFVTNTWTHIALVYDGPNNRTRLYINGIFSEEVNYSSTRNADLGNFQIGNWANSRPFDGLITDFRIWNGIRTESEIQENMNSQLIGTEDGLVAYYTFGDGNGNILTDQTTNNYNGSITGALWTNESAFPTSTVLHGTPGSSDGGLHNVTINVDDGNGGVVSQNYSIAVAVTHLDITGESGFRILSSPVSGAIFGDLLEELWTQGSLGSDLEGAQANVWTYNNGWVPVADLDNDVLDAGQGFVVYVFADTDYDGDDDLPVTIDVDGAINETDVSVTANASQWNLVGNPYGLHVSINQMISDNSSKFNSTVYRLDDANPGYRTHNGTVGNIDQGLIKPFDGFWVQAEAEGDVFEFTEQSIKKGHLHIDGGGRSTTNESTGTATFTFTNGQFTSNVYLSFTESGEINLDPADAKQIIPMSPAQHLTSMIHESGKSLAINNLPYDLETDISFDMDVMMLNPSDDGYETQSEQISMTWDISNLPEGISLSLVNNGTGQTVNLYGYPSSNVALPNKGGFSFPENLMQTYPAVGESQFTLSVYTDIASNDDDDDIIVPADITLHNAYPNPFNPSTMINFDIKEMDDVSLKIFDLTGKQVATLINEVMLPGNHQIIWNPGLLPSGVYLIELIVGKRSLNQKITYIK